MSTIRNGCQALLDLMYPPCCLSCGGTPGKENGLSLCSACESTFFLMSDPSCYKCGLTVGKYAIEKARCLSCKDLSAYFQRAFAVGIYQDSLRDVVRNLKFNGLREAADILAKLMVARLQTAMPDALLKNVDAMIIVPSHPDHIEVRGYDHLHLLATATEKKWNQQVPDFRLPYIKQALQEVHRREPQYKMLSSVARFENVSGNFKVQRPGRFQDKNLLLLDDILTTGATAAECSRILLKSGAKSVCVAVWGRTSNHK